MRYTTQVGRFLSLIERLLSDLNVTVLNSKHFTFLTTRKIYWHINSHPHHVTRLSHFVVVWDTGYQGFKVMPKSPI